jgi:hypothetical protein
MDSSKKPITYWFKAMWWFTTRKTGVNATNLKELLGLGSYGTACCWLQKLRRCTICQDRVKLSGCMEKDASIRDTSRTIWTNSCSGPIAENYTVSIKSLCAWSGRWFNPPRSPGETLCETWTRYRNSSQLKLHREPGSAIYFFIRCQESFSAVPGDLIRWLTAKS